MTSWSSVVCNGVVAPPLTSLVSSRILLIIEIVDVIQSLFALGDRGCRQAQFAADLCVDPLHLIYLLLELDASGLLSLEPLFQLANVGL